MAHLIGALRLARAAAVVNIRETVPDYRYRKSVPIDTVCLALATSRQSQSLAVLRTASHVKPKLPPAETLPWDRKPSLKPNRSMWAKPCVQVADLSFVLDKMTLDSVPRGAVDALADSLSKLSVVDVPCSAVDELSAAFARLTLEDPVVDDLTASFGSMSLEQHSVSLDDLSRVFARCSLEDECGAESTVISELIPMPLGAASTTTNVNLASVNDYEVPATSGIATYINAKSDNEEEVTCLPPSSVSGFTAGDILPHGTSPADWLATAESPQAVDYVRVVDYVRPWIPFAWAQGPMFNVLMHPAADRRPAYESAVTHGGALSSFLGRLFTPFTYSRSTTHLLPLHRSPGSSFSPNTSVSSASSASSGYTSISGDALGSSFSLYLSISPTRSSSSTPGFLSKLKRVFGCQPA